MVPLSRLEDEYDLVYYLDDLFSKEDGYSEFQLLKKYSDDFAIVYEFIRQPSEITYQY